MLVRAGLFLCLFIGLVAPQLLADEKTDDSVQVDADWFRQATISPDGKTILFTYHGDVYQVPASGGMARPLTLNDAWDGHPVWSHDGKQIAFASDRYGNLDVFVMPAKGGAAKRLTYHSANDTPTDFSPDHSQVLFSSARTDSAAASLFPTSRLAELYTVKLNGGTPEMVTTIPASQARYAADGKRILYRDEKAYESPWRKHDVSAFARDIWLLDTESDKHRQITDFTGGDHNPVWSSDDQFYYLSEDGGGTFNVWKSSLDGDQKTQITELTTHPVRNLSIASDGTLAFTHHGGIFTLVDGKAPRRVKVTFAHDGQDNDYVNQQLAGKISQFAVSPSGKEIAFVARGEVFVTSRDFRTTRRITNTPQQERSVSFHKDGRTLLYAAERDSKWKLFEASLQDSDEKYFFAATKIEEKEIHSAKTESFQPVYSPDGTKIAFLAGRDEIQVLDRESGDTNVALSKIYNYSYSDGDIAFGWSPDSQWLIADFAPRGRLFTPNIGIFPADGSKEPVDITLSGYNDVNPFWGKSGDVVYWSSSRYGRRDHGSWGRQYDVLATFLTQDAYDKFTLTKEEYELQQELKKENEKSGEKSKSEKSTAKQPANIEIQWEGLDDRTVRLTQDSSNLQSYVLTKDTSKLYFIKQYATGNELWERNFREDSLKRVKTMGPGAVEFVLSNDEKMAFMLSGGSLSFAKLDSIASSKPIAVDAVMQLKPAAEREYMFDHSWRQIKDKFYKRDFHGIDWDAMKTAYQAKLPSIGHGRDMAVLMSELTGELNVSHIGVSYRPAGARGSDRTAELGVIFDMSDTSGPLKIEEVLDKSLLQKSNSRVKAGMKLSAIDGVKLDGTVNLAQLLNGKTGQRVRLSIIREDDTKFDEVTKPISAGRQSQLLYERWVKQRRELVEKLSNGRLGYVHVRGMNDASFRVVYSEIMGRNFEKEAIIVDTRWNGGGWLHNDLAKLLSGTQYSTMHVRGREYPGDSIDQWNKPSVLVVGEGNYSDAYGFPFTYRALEIGEMVGMPVPGTMTAVWWETSLSGDLRVGVPQVGVKNNDGEYLENKQIEPEHQVKNDPDSSVTGEDKQIAKAVEIMLDQLGQPDEQ